MSAVAESFGFEVWQVVAAVGVFDDLVVVVGFGLGWGVEGTDFYDFCVDAGAGLVGDEVDDVFCGDFFLEFEADAVC